jgi:hypothetical protein
MNGNRDSRNGNPADRGGSPGVRAEVPEVRAEVPEVRAEVPEVLVRMSGLIDRWEKDGDRRTVFLRCYSLMTANMHEAIRRGDFADGPWVDRLLHRFAEYYFEALEQWERRPAGAPRVWQLAHESTRGDGDSIWQQLLLGVNAHINYDLVLTVLELLDAEWGGMTPARKAERYDDYCRVNEIIASTIDAVQDDVLAPAMPASAVIDILMGRVDEFMISRLITSWRDRTWDDALRLLEAPDPATRGGIVAQVEDKALRTASYIRLGKSHDFEDIAPV